MGRAHLILLLGFLLLLGLEDYDLSRQQATSSFSFLRGASAASVGKAYRGRRRCHTRRDHIPRPAAYHDEPHSHHHHHAKHKDSYDRDVHYSRHSAAGDRSQVAKDYSAFSALAGPSFLELDSKQFPQLSQLFQNQQQMPQMPQMPQMAQMQQTPPLPNDPRSIMAMSQPQPLPTGINVLDQISHASPRPDQTPWSLPKMVNDLGLAIIATNRQWFSNCTYFNGNVWMVGFSHMCSATNLASMRDSVCAGCFQGGAAYGLTLQEAIGVLKQDVHPCEGFIGAEADVSRLTSNQFSSLVSFCDGVGQSNLQGSSFLHMLQAGQWDQIPEELVKWDKIGNGQFSQQMQLRRRNEAMLFTTPDSAKTLSQPPMPSPSQLRQPPQPDNQQFASPQDMVMSIRSRRAHAYDPPSFYDYKRSESDHRSPPKGDDDDEDCEEELGSGGGREQSRLSTRGALLNDVEGAQFPRLKEERQDAKAAGKHKASSKAEIWESAESVPDESGGYILPNPFGHSAGELESSREGYTYHHNFFVGPGPSDYFMDHWSHPDPSVTHPAPVDGKAMPADTRPWGDVPQTGSSGSDRHASHW